MVYPCNPSYLGCLDREPWSETGLRQKVQDHLRKITKAKRVGGVGQEVEQLSSKYKALSSNPVH
jgi:hypothetical protein